jgi:hypothetical protein
MPSATGEEIKKTHLWRTLGALRALPKRSAGGPELRKSGRLQPRKLSGPQQRKFCIGGLKTVLSYAAQRLRSRFFKPPETNGVAAAGNTGLPAAQGRLTALSGSWRAQLWLARAALPKLKSIECILQMSITSRELQVTTGKKAASDASKVLRNPKSSARQKEIAASDLAQARHKSPAKKRGR